MNGYADKFPSRLPGLFTVALLLPLFFLAACLPELDVTANPRFSAFTQAVIPNDGSDTTCPTGGWVIATGFDADGSGTLDATEIEDTYKICNGTNGVDGTDGTNGTNGLDGSAVQILDFDPALAGCTSGGYLVRSGVDTDADGLPNAPFTEYTICTGGGMNQGTSGGAVAMTAVSGTGYTFPFSGSVAPMGTSYYTLTPHTDDTLPSPLTWDGPYTLRFHGLESNLTPVLWSGVTFGTGTEVSPAINCTFSPFWLFKECTTKVLTAGTPNGLTVAEGSSVNNQFLIEALYGAFDGSYDAPVPLGAGLTAITHPDTVVVIPYPGSGASAIGYVGLGDFGEGQSSYYGFWAAQNPDTDPIYTVSVDDIVVPPGEAGPQMAWKILDASGNTVVPSQTGSNPRPDTEQAGGGPLNRLVAASNLPVGPYTLQVSNRGTGAKFRAFIASGDHLSTLLPPNPVPIEGGMSYFSTDPGTRLFDNATFTGVGQDSQFRLFEGDAITGASKGGCGVTPPATSCSFLVSTTAGAHTLRALNRGTPTSFTLNYVAPTDLFMDTPLGSQTVAPWGLNVYAIPASDTTHKVVVALAAPTTIYYAVAAEALDASGNSLWWTWLYPQETSNYQTFSGWVSGYTAGPAYLKIIDQSGEGFGYTVTISRPLVLNPGVPQAAGSFDGICCTESEPFKVTTTAVARTFTIVTTPGLPNDCSTAFRLYDSNNTQLAYDCPTTFTPALGPYNTFTWTYTFSAAGDYYIKVVDQPGGVAHTATIMVN